MAVYSNELVRDEAKAGDSLAIRLPRLLDLIAAKPYFTVAEASVIADLKASQLYHHAKLGHLTIRRGRVQRENLDGFLSTLVEGDGA
jgi:hypothetical protein